MSISKMSKKESARLGGLALVSKRGKEYMKQIGSKGGKATWKKYYLIPIGINDFAIVDKETHQPRSKTLAGLLIDQYKQR